MGLGFGALQRAPHPHCPRPANAARLPIRARATSETLTVRRNLGAPLAEYELLRVFGSIHETIPKIIICLYTLKHHERKMSVSLEKIKVEQGL